MKTLAIKFLRGFTQFCVVVVLSLILVVAAELGAREIVRKIRWEQPVYMLSFTDKNIRDLYNTDNPDFYRSVVKDGWRDGRQLVYEPFLEFQTRAHQGEHFSVAPDRFRSTADGPKTLRVDGPRVYVYGGSTTFGMGVSERETIPYFIHQHLRSAGFSNVHVFNFGVPGYYSTQEIMLFQRHIREGNGPDIAIFVDGLNDFYMCQVPDRSGQSWLIERVLAGTGEHNMGRILAQRSNVLKLIRIYQGKEIPGQRDGNPCGSLDNAARVIERLDVNRRMIAAIGEQLNISTIFVQQPVPTYGYDNSKRPVPLQDMKKLGLHNNSAIGYPMMIRQREAGALFSKDVLWLENAKIDRNMYVDLVHYSPQFNDEIAKQIADHVIKNHSIRIAKTGK